MNILTNLLYIISTGMLIPVIVLLLLMFAWSLLSLGNFFQLYMSREKYQKQIRELLQQARTNSIRTLAFEAHFSSRSAFLHYVTRLQKCRWKETQGEKIITEFEQECQQQLEHSKTLARVGPMLGLMGTLIPMGPALAGLAAGDIASMALNMQVAFSTTVIGIFVAAVGYIVQLVKQRWFLEDFNNLQYIFTLAREEGHEETQ